MGCNNYVLIFFIKNFRRRLYPCMLLTVELYDDSLSIKERQWTFSVWKHYNIQEGKHFPNGKDRAYYKYCNEGPVDAYSSNATFNFRHHTES